MPGLARARLAWHSVFPPREIIGSSPLQIAALYDGRDEAERSLGLAAINAISQSVFTGCGHEPEPAADSLGTLQTTTGDHLGMVGYFPSLLEKLRGARVEVTVIEKKPQFLGIRDYFRVSGKLADLRECNRVLVTASTLLNDSIDEVLDNCTHAQAMSVIGPTASFIPDPLFSRNVSAVGGLCIRNSGQALEHLRCNMGVGASGYKYMIRKNKYKGIGVILGTEG